MAKKTEENKPQQAPTGEMVKIPHEYLIEGVRQAVEEVKAKMAEARAKYCSQYNWKNPYEEFYHRFGYDNPEKIWEEYDLVWNKQSAQPAVIRKIIKILGDTARYYAIARLRQEMKQEKKEE